MKRSSLPSLFSRDRSPMPFFDNLQREMDRAFDRFRAAPESWLSEGMFHDGPVMPALDVAVTDEAVEITAEVPGVSEDDLDVSIADGVLTLKGEKSSSHEEKEENYQLIERRYGSFSRQIPLGFTPKDGSVKTEFKDGVLKLHIPKPAEAKAAVQKIKISK
jgi:HSP20 family protein